MGQTRDGDQRSQSEVRKAIGLRLRQVRERLGESQTKFAERLGVTKLSALTYETGVSCPRADQLCALASTGVDASFVAFGVPSLASAESRRQFASALAWVRRECEVSSLKVPEEGLVEAAWLIFCGINKQPSADVPAESDMQARAKAALEPIAHKLDVLR